MSKGRFWTENEVRVLKEEFRFKPVDEIAASLDRSEYSIRMKAFSLGLIAPRTWLPAEETILKENYSDKRVKELKKLLPTHSEKAITLRAHELGIGKYKRPSYEINENFFKDLNHDSAYVLGVIASDGNIIIRETGSWNFKITSKDKEWLISIRNLMKSNMKLKPVVGQWGHLAWDLIITRRNMINDLLGLGITPKKSMTLRFPEIPPEYVPSFMRGYHDGDGSFSFHKNHNQITLRSITAGNFVFLMAWKDWLNKLGIDTKASIHFTKSKIHVLHLSERNAIEFGDMIYSAPGLRLERKYKKYLDGKSLFQNSI